MIKSYTLLFIICLSVISKMNAQQNPTPAPKQTKTVLIMNAIAHVGDGTVIENSAIAIKDGKIAMIADARVIRLDLTAYDTTIYASGMHVYPGFIATNSTLGLHELDLVRQTNDMAETGTYKPSIRSAIAYNTDSEIIPTVRSNGVLMGQIVPRGGVISGTSSVMQFDAWNWEDALIKADDGVHLNWPAVYHRHYDKGKILIEKVKTYDQQLREIQNFFNDARAYCLSNNKSITEVRFEGLRGIFEGKQKLYIHADDVKSITEAVSFKQQMAIPEMVIVGGYDAYLVADMLKSNNVSVMLQRLHTLPWFNEDDVDLPFKLPKLLYDKGVKFCLQNAGDMERMGARNLPFYGGTAVAYGLPYEEAVRALTLAPAEILGIDQQCGSLETDKDATLFISTGDALDMKTNNVVYAFIQGRMIDLNNKQTELYLKYKKKYEGE
jgi:imidazolonepropionase-like amidohydrolase